MNMSTHLHSKENQIYRSAADESDNKKVNLNDLVARLKAEKKKDTKNNVILFSLALSVLVVFGIVLTL